MAGRVLRLLSGDEPSTLESLFGPEAFEVEVRRLVVSWLVVMPLAVLVAVATLGDEVSWTGQCVVIAGSLAGLALSVVVARSDVVGISRWFGPLGLVLSAFVLANLIAVGPHFSAAASIIPGVTGLAFVVLSRRSAIALALLLIVGWCLIVSLMSGYPRPVAQILPLASFTGASTVCLNLVVGRVHEVARKASADAQRLQEYVAPQVAAAVRSASNLEPHRRQIAVWFCDLRGFTSFTAGAEPEEVVDVLSEYYAVVGDKATAAGATIGAFAGDGIHGYFGDPEPHPDPAGAAVRLAVGITTALDDLGRRWAERGYDLGHGIGIAYGYATLGTVGYEGRRDYTALGSVVNLAARLCGEAADGEILLDPKAAAAVQDQPTTTRSLTLKGFDRPVTAHVLGARG